MAPVVTRGWFSAGRIVTIARFGNDADISVSTTAHERRRGPDAAGRLPRIAKF